MTGARAAWRVSSRVSGPLLVGGLLAGCSVPLPFSGPSPAEACRAVNESVHAAVPPGESVAELQVRGIRVRTPLRFAPGTAPRPAQSSGAAVRMLIAPDGSVVPGSPKALKVVGEPHVAAAMEAAALSMSFDVDPGVHSSTPVPFTTALAICPRS